MYLNTFRHLKIDSDIWKCASKMQLDMKECSCRAAAYLLLSLSTVMQHRLCIKALERVFRSLPDLYLYLLYWLYLYFHWFLALLLLSPWHRVWTFSFGHNDGDNGGENDDDDNDDDDDDPCLHLLQHDAPEAALHRLLLRVHTLSWSWLWWWWWLWCWSWWSSWW